MDRFLISDRLKFGTLPQKYRAPSKKEEQGKRVMNKIRVKLIELVVT